MCDESTDKMWNSTNNNKKSNSRKINSWNKKTNLTSFYTLFILVFDLNSVSVKHAWSYNDERCSCSVIEKTDQAHFKLWHICFAKKE